MDRGFLLLSLLATLVAGSLCNSPVFPYTPALLPSSGNVLYIFLIHTYVSLIVIDHELSLEQFP